jgi:hypothetical protein
MNSIKEIKWQRMRFTVPVARMQRKEIHTKFASECEKEYFFGRW